MKHFKKAMICLILLAVAVYLLLAFYIANNALQDDSRQADVILVAGARVFRGDSYNPCLIARIKHAVDLYKAHYAPVLLLSGGTDKETNANEAETMKKIAVSLGVPAEDILLESASTSTYENMLFSKKILTENNLKNIILVTEPFHAPRASLAAKKQGLRVMSSPASQSICWTKYKYLSIHFLREPLALFYYKIKNRL